MFHLFFIEKSRRGEFNVSASDSGCVSIFHERPILVHAKSTNPDQDFSFDITSTNGGIISISYDEIKETKFMEKEFIIKNVDASVTATVFIVTPYPYDFGEPIKIAHPKYYTIGHRGSGNNLVTQDHMENSIGGFLAARDNNANFVEFDVQQTKDNVNVIMHDFFVKNSEEFYGIKPHKVGKTGTKKYVVNQFTEEEFRKTGLSTIYQQERITLQDLLTKIPVDLKFDIEMKYPSTPRFIGKVPYAERNKFVDHVLDDIKQFGGERELFFSAFDPYIVTMLELKQRRFPVYQLYTNEDKDTWENTIAKLDWYIPLHKYLKTPGFVINSLFFLPKSEYVTRLLNEGFTVSTYGAPNNEIDTVQQQLELGVTGICTDFLPKVQDTITNFHDDK